MDRERESLLWSEGRVLVFDVLTESPFNHWGKAVISVYFIFDITIKIFNILLSWTKLNLLNILCIQGRSNNYNCIYLFICNLKSVILKIFIIMSKLLVSSDFCVFNNYNNSFFLHYQNLFQRNPQRNCCVSPNESRFWMNHLNWWFINSLIKALEWCGVNRSTTPKTCYLFHSLMNL